MVRYINMKGNYGIETVDEFPYNNREERAEAKRCLNEYRYGDTCNTYYLSQRSTNDWRNKE